MRNIIRDLFCINSQTMCRVFEVYADNVL